MTPATVLVIGGGIAGSAVALRLRQHQVTVDLVEKQQFPRDKVCGCCLGGAGLEMLRQLGLRDRVLELGATTHRWCASIGGRRLELSLPEGVAISRRVLDPLMLQAARDAGANVAMCCQATIAEVTAETVAVKFAGKSAPEPRSYDCVVVATGLRAAGLNELLPWTETPHGPFGISLMASSESVQPGVIYMACDDDGYVGLVQLPDGRIDVAAALASGGKAASQGNPLERIQTILTQSAFAPLALTDPSPLLTTPPLRRTRRAGSGRVLAIGDAAGYVEPFTGEGMTWAMQSAIAAADTIAATRADLRSAGDLWNREIGALLRGKKRTCRLVTNALRSPWARRVAAETLTIFPGLSKPLLRSLNRP